MGGLARVAWVLVASFLARAGAATRKVAVIGAGGFIGSRLHEHLIESGHAVTGYDRFPNLGRATPALVHKASPDIDDAELRSYDVVVFLGGLTGRAACEAATPEVVRAENVREPVAVASRMAETQVLIFATTSARRRRSVGLEKKIRRNRPQNS